MLNMFLIRATQALAIAVAMAGSSPSQTILKEDFETLRPGLYRPLSPSQGADENAAVAI